MKVLIIKIHKIKFRNEPKPKQLLLTPDSLQTIIEDYAEYYNDCIALYKHTNDDKYLIYAELAKTKYDAARIFAFILHEKGE